MAVQTFSLKRDGDTMLTDNFKIREFRCNKGFVHIDSRTQKYYSKDSGKSPCTTFC